MLMDLAAQLRSLPIKHRSKSSELTWIVIALPADARHLPEGFLFSLTTPRQPSGRLSLRLNSNSQISNCRRGLRSAPAVR